MFTEHIALPSQTPGHRHQLTVLRFGQAGRGPKAYLQSALHADEIPAMLVAQKLRALLAAEDAAGRVLGEVVFHREPGDLIAAGSAVADLVDTGTVTTLRAQSSGVLYAYARVATRWATTGKRLAKIAGTTLERKGKLLGA